MIAFFDALSESQVSVDALLRSAASLLGAPVGLRLGESARVSLAATDGTMSKGEAEVDPGWPTSTWGASREHRAFVVREGGERNVNDLLVLERLGLALRTADERARTPGERPAAEVLLDDAASVEDRGRAAGRLHLPNQGVLRVTATPFGQDLGRGSANGSRTAVLFTPVGMLRGTILIGAEAAGAATPGGEPSRQGEAAASGIDGLPAAWRRAVTALRMSSQRRPTVSAEDLGDALALAATPADSPDQLRLTAAQQRFEWTAETAEALGLGESVREAARLLGVHHSTLQRRLEELSGALGFDVATPDGRFRLRCAHLARTFHTARF